MEGNYKYLTHSPLCLNNGHGIYEIACPIHTLESGSDCSYLFYDHVRTRYEDSRARRCYCHQFAEHPRFWGAAGLGCTVRRIRWLMSERIRCLYLSLSGVMNNLGALLLQRRRSALVRQDRSPVMNARIMWRIFFGARARHLVLQWSG